jgi:hypothetical protein
MTTQVQNRLRKAILYPVTCILLLSSFHLKGQDYNPRKDEHNTFYYAHWRAYGFYDVVRQTGIGVAYAPHPNIELAASVGYINSFAWRSSDLVSVGDYFYYKGQALNFSATFYSKRNQGFYSGVHCSFSSYGYKNQWVLPGDSYDGAGYNYSYYQPAMELRDRKMTSWAGGPTIGSCFRGEHCSVNFFVRAGLEIAEGDIHVTQVSGQLNSYGPSLPTPPYSYHSIVATPYVMSGLSIGLSNKSKQGYMFRYYKQLFLNRMTPLIQKSRRLRRRGLMTFGDMIEVRITAEQTYKRMYSLYMDSIFDDSLMEKELEEGVKEIQKIFDNPLLLDK